MSRRVSVSAAEARRIALAAQGFQRQRPASPTDVRHFRRAMSHIAVLQLDFVNVLLPAHFLMLWSRLGAYDRSRFETYLYSSGEYIEHWAHEASVVASSDWPLLAYRRASYQPWKNSPLNQLPDRDAYLQRVLDHVRQNGCTTAQDLPSVKTPKGKPGDWHRPIPRCGLEYHFGTGAVSVSCRRRNFQRVYDITERVVAAGHRERRVDVADAHRQLLRKASASLGIATAHDLADYYRMTVGDVLPRIEELVDEGALIPVQVEDWPAPAWLDAAAVSPRSIDGASLLSPFDPVVWYRPRAARLFNFEYRIEIYVPEARRRWGYYVLPFRQGSNITARVDLKANRADAVLEVRRAHLEPGAECGSTSAALATELRCLADWLSLDGIRIEKASAFEKALASAIAVV